MVPKLFPTDMASILARLESVDPVSYAETRNFTDGRVSRLSPYISRGVISLKKVAEQVVRRHPITTCSTFLKELAWREYWQRVWENRGDEIFSDLKYQQTNVRHRDMPSSILNGNTGIRVIDQSITELKETGYMHNHVRMYLASLACNRGGAHWKVPASWMYYHLLDGDIASNTLSWQWVAGTFSSKQYWCNQDNINHYTKTIQHNSILDMPYDRLVLAPVPKELTTVEALNLSVQLPSSDPLPDQAERIFLYTSYNLDPVWHAGKEGTRILLLEPAHFNRFPVSRLVMSFILSLAENIPGLLVFCGSFDELAKRFPGAEFIFRKHASCTHYRGTSEDPEYLFPEVYGYFPSFSSYWKKASILVDKLKHE